MTVSRRNFLATLTGTGLTISLAGCTNSQELQISAAPARYSPETISQSPYRFIQKRKLDTNELLEEFTSVNARINADSYLSSYAHENQLQGATILSTPSVKLGERELNPLSQDIENVMEYTVRFANRQSSQTNVTIQNYELQDEITLNTTLGEQTGYRYEVIAQTEQVGKVTFDALISVLSHQSSVLLVGGAVLKEVEESSEQLSEILDNTTEDFSSIKTLLENIDHPVEWDEIGSDE